MARTRRDERGAVAVMMALVITFVAIPVAALSVDLGLQRVARKDAQSVADTSALDAARALAANASMTNAQVTAVAAASAARDSKLAGATPAMTAYVGYIAPNATFVSDQTLGCGASTYNTYFTSVPSGKTANAVLVVGRASVSRVMAQALGAGPGSVCRSAVATTSLRACMTMDSYAAALSGSDSSVLGPIQRLLGANLTATALGSSGILTANITALDFLNALQVQLGLASTTQVLAANVTAAQVLQAEETVLYNAGLLQSRGLLQGASIAGTSTFAVSSLIGITQGGSSALGATVNPLDLAMASAQLANGTNAVAVSVASSNLTGLSASATIGTRPTQVCLGQGAVTMNQTYVGATANINAPGSLTGAVTNLVGGLQGLLNGVLGLLGGLLGADTYGTPVVTLGQVNATVSLANASGTVTALNCSGATPTSISALESSSLAASSISIPLTVRESRTYGPIFNRQTETVTSTLTITVTVPPASNSVTGTLNVPGDYDKGVAGPSNNLAVNTATVSVALQTDGTFSNGYALVNKLLSSLASVTNQINTTLISTLQSTVVTPLFNSLTSTLTSTVGTTIAGTTYTPRRTPSCGVPGLG